MGSKVFGPRRGSATKVVLLALVAIAAVALYLLRSDSGPREPVAAVPAHREVPAEANGMLESAAKPPAATATALRSNAMPVEVTEAPVAASEAADSDDAEGEWVEVLCVHAAGGAPVVGIDVYALPLDQSLAVRLQASMASGTDLAAMLRDVVAPVITDETGLARVRSLPDANMVYVALGPGVMGSAHPEVEGGRVTLEVNADHRLRVSVVDSGGVGVVGAVVSARALLGESRHDLFTTLTDGEGRAELRLPGEMVSQYVPGTLVVGVKGLFPAFVEQPLDLEAPEPRFELPPFGWAVLSPGSTDEAQPDVRLTLRATAPGPASTLWTERLEGLTGPDGSLRLGPIALGVSLSATGSAVGSPVAWHAEGRGPTVQGETVQLVLHKAAAFPLRARALNPAGEPFARALLQARLLEPGAELSEEGLVERLRTDKDGIFTWDLPAQTVPGSAAWLSVARRGVDYTAAFAVPVADTSGIDLGDLQFREVPPAAQGRVLDPEGVPIAGATTQLFRRVWSDVGSELRAVATTRTGADGRFVLRAPAAEGDLEVRVSAKGFVRSTHKLEFESDVGDVRLAKAGGLRGRVLLGELWGPNLYVGVQSESGWVQFTGLDESGEFVVDGLGSDSWSVFLHGGALLGGDVALWPKVDFHAESGSMDLGLVDLTGRLLRSEVIAQSPEGRPLHALQIFSVDELNDFSASSTALGGGRHVLLHPTELSTVRVSAEGYRTVRITLHGGRQELTLQPALTVVLRARGADNLPAGVVLSVRVQGPDPEQPSRLQPLPKGRAEFHVDEPGTYRLRFHVARVDGPSSRISAGEPHHTMEVLETRGPQEFEVMLPEELLAEAQRLTSGD